MDKLKDQLGYTIMETLVGIILIGLIITFFAMFFNQIFSNPKLLLRSEALTLANLEIEKSINTKAINDTIYKNTNGNLLIKRNIKQEKKLVKSTVVVQTVSSKDSILTLTALYKL